MQRQLTIEQTNSINLSANRQAELKRMTEVCGNGEMPFPSDLPPDEAHALALLVRNHRRTRLIDFLARQIAADFIRRS